MAGKRGERSSAWTGRSVLTGRIYYGWIQVATLAFTEMTSWGILYYTFGVFLLPMQQELGWSRTALTGAFSLALLVSGLAGVPAGWWLDRDGPRRLMTLGSIGASTLVLSWASVTELWVFYLIWIGIGLTLAAVLYEPAFVVVATWFDRLRGRALTVLTFGGGLASVVYIPLAEWLVRAQGWRPALVTLAVILATGTIPLHALVLRRHPRDLGLLPDGAAVTSDPTGRGARAVSGVPLRVVVQHRGLWWLAAAFALANVAASAVGVHLFPYLVERGFSTRFAAGMAGLIAIMALPGRLAFTPLGSHVPRRRIAAMLFLLQALALGALMLVPGRGGVYLFVLLFGAGFGAITPARAALVAELYGVAAYGRINSIVAACSTIARAVAPVGAAALYTAFGGYRPVMWSLAALSAAAVGAVLLVTQPHA